jgi:hypothetical protein
MKDGKEAVNADKSENVKDLQPARPKRTAKNSVFLDLFQDKKYLLQLYQTLHPEDTEATEDALDIVTIENVLTDNIYNDLGLLVYGHKLLILVEAQSTWTLNILVRIFMYLAQTYHEYFLETGQNLYKSAKVKMPKPELYVIYTGEKEEKPNVISLSKDFFESEDIDIDIKAKVIYERETDDIINQYIVFCKVFDDQRKLYGMTDKAITETIRICQDRNVLRNYLENRKREVVTIMKSLFDEDEILDMYVKDKQREAAREAARETARVLIKMNKMSIGEIAECIPALSIDELREIESEVMQTV